MRLVVEGVTRAYPQPGGGQVVALADVSFAVEPHEFVALVGPSGCGKSTLLNMVAGLLQPTSGRIYFTGLAGAAPRVGMVFQDHGLFPWRTVLDNVAFGLEELGMGRQEREALARRYIQLVGLEGFERAYPHQLSGGMRQRVGIARALAIEPELLLMDEPFSALDAQTRMLMQSELLAIWNQTRHSTLYVTHNIHEAVYLADRVLVLSRRPGRLTANVPIRLPRDRRDELQTSPEFLAHVDEIWQLIRAQALEAMKEGA